MFVKRLLLGDRPTASNMQSGGEGAMKNRGQKKVSMATVRRARHCVPGTVRLEVPPPPESVDVLLALPGEQTLL